MLPPKVAIRATQTPLEGSDIDIPADLAAFLDAARQLEYDPATFEAGEVTLLPREKLQLRTFGAQTSGTPHEESDPNRVEGVVYEVPDVDLIASCTGDYDPEGLLIWFPGESSYGVWDPAHDFVLIFGTHVTWAEIAASPARYINAQWEFEEQVLVLISRV